METIKTIILDDHPVVREGLIYMIEREPDMKVLADSGDSNDAIELVREHKPDVLLLDVHMEGQTFNVVKKAVSVHPEVKVLFITAFDTQDNYKKAEKFGGAGLVSKLEGAKGICNALRAVARGETYFHPEEAAERKAAAGGYQHIVRGKDVPEHHPLSPREVDILCCVAHAMTAKEIAKELHISVKTVDRHKANIMEKLNMRSQIELARYAIKNGFVEA
jgi:DNA-binding NarL/FixJ family response regulator